MCCTRCIPGPIKECFHLAECDHTPVFCLHELKITKDDIVRAKLLTCLALAARVLHIPLLVDVEIINLVAFKAEASGESKLCVESVATPGFCSEGCKFNSPPLPAVTCCLSGLSSLVIILTDRWDVMTHLALVCC